MPEADVQRGSLSQLNPAGVLPSGNALSKVLGLE